jgi:N-acetylneuraminic acid mutarotase
MDRMAKHTKQPEILHELFDALGNDPFVIAECLARPLLAERLLTELYAPDRRFDDGSKQWWLGDAETRVLMMAAVRATYTLPVIASPSGGCTDDTWTAISSTGAPANRYHHTAVWTGSEMIVWGGFGMISPGPLNTGGRYNPSTDSWAATSTANAPDARFDHTAVWTGSEMIVWGGDYFGPLSDTGGRYNPTTDSWTATSNALGTRSLHTAVWTGSEMIVWGGIACAGGCYSNSGGRYNPGTDSWTATSLIGAPAGRDQHTAAWAGSEMIVWGGYGEGGFLNTGGRYNPSTNSWAATSAINAPSGRDQHRAVWADSEMIVWGGYNSSYLNTGGRYNPSINSWTATSTTNAPAARWEHTAVWTGSQMIVWGGDNGSSYFNTGGRYNLSADNWTATSTTNAPSARSYHTAVWTGNQMIVWGGVGDDGLLNTGGRYCGQSGPPPTPTPTPTASPTSTPMVVLYDQYNDAGTYGTLSATFTDSPSHNADLADDFVVPVGQIWNVQSIDADGGYIDGSGPATDWNVFFYTDNGGFPGTQVYSATQQLAMHSGTTFTVNLPAPAVLPAGTYWVEIQANMTFACCGEWVWSDRTITSNNAAAWQNPGGGFGPPPSCPAPGCPVPCPNCISWGIKQCCTGIPGSEADQMFRLRGTIGEASPTPTPTPTPTPCTGRCAPTPRSRPTPAPRPSR